MKTVFEITLISLAYLLGSIPFGYIFTKKFAGKNIQEFGSGNIGSTNVRRVAGYKVALLTQLCDMMKGLLPIAAILLLRYYNVYVFDNYILYIVALAAILGHNFSVFLNFKGGKGVNTTLGASILLSPVTVLTSVLVYFFVKRISNYVSLGSICLAITLPVSEFILHSATLRFYYFVICSLLIIIMHLPNIVRLINGNEIKSKN
ncbi:MAG: glycerol-3-phosphate 1-O-acyltransferase PlsY [Paludibacter sp.]|nr:glycerol-3-phosphate 1-O-acyltransferase PlsY [Paludibacter sp.]